MNKLSQVLAVLKQHPDIAAWYFAEHALNLDTLTADSVRTYGTGGHGDIADAILADGEAS